MHFIAGDVPVIFLTVEIPPPPPIWVSQLTKIEIKDREDKKITLGLNPKNI